MSHAFPKVLVIKQKFASAPDLPLPATISSQFGVLRQRIRPGARIAVAVGSRGITNLRQIVEAVVGQLKEAKAIPFLIPAMGSHGGATPEGQTELLAGYGISEATLGIPIESTMDVECIGSLDNEIKIFCSVPALRSDGIVLINRIKPHTDFSGGIGSGLMKMMVIGLGKQVGAAQYHIQAGRHGYEDMLRGMARIVLEKMPILGGVGIVENQRHETAQIEVVPREALEAREAAMFQVAARLMPKLPFDDIDLLVVDRIGKNISGSGMDPNVVGRSVHGYSSFLGQKNLPAPRIKRIFVRELTPETHGNAIGLGFADFTTERMVAQMNRQVTYVNALTSLTPNSVKIPIYVRTDREALLLAMKSLGQPDFSQVRLVRIADTLSLERLEISEAFAAELTGRKDLDLKRGPEPWLFDSEDNLPPIAGLALPAKA